MGTPMEETPVAGIEEVVKLRIVSRPEFIRKVREIIDELGQKMGFASRKIGELKLAVNEAIANIFKHAYKNQTDKPIYLYFVAKPQQIEIVIRDFGTRPEPGQLKTRDLNQLEDRGLGLLFMKKYVDDLSFDFSQKVGTQVRFVKLKE